MKALLLAVAASALIAAAAGPASADPGNHGDRGDQGDRGGQGNQGGRGEHRGWGQDYGAGGHHWRRHERMGYNDWNGAQRIDYREHHLRRPPYGYEWRESNGQYVLAAVATGVILSIMLDGH